MVHEVPYENYYSCAQAEFDMDTFFQKGKSVLKADAIRFNGEAEEALERCLKHMTRGTTVPEAVNIACQHCWKRFLELKRLHGNA